MKKSLILILTVFLIPILLFFVSISSTRAACGVQVAGSCANCSSVCLQWCRGSGNPDCENINDPYSGPPGCCYTGMDSACNSVTGQCQCDDWDPNPSNDPWVPMSPECLGIGMSIPPAIYCGDGVSNMCCSNQAECDAAFPPTPTTPPVPTAANTPTPAPFSPLAPPSNETFNAVNPLYLGGGADIDDGLASAYKDDLSTPGGIISRALTFIFPLAGLLLFALLVWGGFEMLIGSPTKKSMESGKNRITAALAGFFLLFASYWIWQIVEIIFGVAIL